MADGILKTLTIDGTSLDMHDAEQAQKITNIATIAANTAAQGDTITLTKKGIYVMTATFGVGAATATGARLVQTRIMQRSAGSNWAVTRQEQVPASGIAIQINECICWRVSTVPMEVYGEVICDKAINTNTSISLICVRLINEA